METVKPIVVENYSLIGQHWYSPTRSKVVALVFVMFIALVVTVPVVLLSDDDDNEPTQMKQNSSINTEQAMSQPDPDPVVASIDPVVASTEPVIEPVSVTVKLNPVNIVQHKYVLLYHPLMTNNKQFVETEEVERCPHGTGISVLFGHTECQGICNFMNDCIGYNFDTVRNLCTFYANIDCLDYLADANDIEGYIQG